MSELLKFFLNYEVCILMVGFDVVGKIMILYKLKLNEIVSIILIIGFNVEIVSLCKGVIFIVWDVGG